MKKHYYKNKIFFGLILFTLGMMMFLGLYQEPLNGESIDCYDRHNNKIIGQECIVENSFDNKTTQLLVLSIFPLLFGVCGIFIGYMLDDIDRMMGSRGGL